MLEAKLVSLPISVIDTVFDGLVEACQDDAIAIAKHLESRVLALSATSVARAFEMGKLLGTIREGEFFSYLGFSDFDAFLKEKKLAKTTVYRDMAIAQRFSLKEHGHLGITRLRLLANRSDALDLINLGMPAPDGAREPIAAIKSRDLQARLQALPVVEPELLAAVSAAVGQPLAAQVSGERAVVIPSAHESDVSSSEQDETIAETLDKPAAAVVEQSVLVPAVEAGTKLSGIEETAAGSACTPLPFPANDPIWAQVS